MNQPNPPMFIIATLKVRPGKMTECCEVVPKIVSIMEQNGWRLLGAWTNLVGRLNVIVDLWQVVDANATITGMTSLLQSSEWPELSKQFTECVEEETLQIMSRVPYDPGLF